MSTLQTQLFDPPIRAKVIDENGRLTTSFRQYLFTLQNLLPLVQVDTTSGNLSEGPPPAGLNSTTGQSNQNMEITFIKISADGHSFTLTGIELGSIVLTAQGDKCKIKSDGTNWWRSG